MILDDSARVRIVRAMLGITAKDLAAKMGVSERTIGQWEHGKATPQTAKRQLFVKLCEDHGIAHTPSGMPIPVKDLASIGGAHATF